MYVSGDDTTTNFSICQRAAMKIWNKIIFVVEQAFYMAFFSPVIFCIITNLLMTVNKVEKFFVCFVIWLVVFFFGMVRMVFLRNFRLRYAGFSCSLLCFSFFRLLCCQFRIEHSRLFHTSVIERTQYNPYIYAHWCSTSSMMLSVVW